jgi:hypothetical protein
MIKRRLLIALAIILVVVALLSSYFTFTCFSDGQRAGSIIKFSHKGMIFKTAEGEMMQRVLVASAPQDTWKFSCNDPAVEAMINEAMIKGDPVVLHYCQKYYTFSWQGDTEYFITKVDKITN